MGKSDLILRNTFSVYFIYASLAFEKVTEYLERPFEITGGCVRMFIYEKAIECWK
jgi:hypothetical protein